MNDSTHTHLTQLATFFRRHFESNDLEFSVCGEKREPPQLTFLRITNKYSDSCGLAYLPSFHIIGKQN
jgi:hypothetical protein